MALATRKPGGWKHWSRLGTAKDVSVKQLVDDCQSFLPKSKVRQPCTDHVSHKGEGRCQEGEKIFVESLSGRIKNGGRLRVRSFAWARFRLTNGFAYQNEGSGRLWPCTCPEACYHDKTWEKTRAAGCNRQTFFFTLTWLIVSWLPTATLIGTQHTLVIIVRIGHSDLSSHPTLGNRDLTKMDMWVAPELQVTFRLEIETIQGLDLARCAVMCR